MAEERNSGDVNEIVVALHTAAELAGMTIATDDDLRNLADKVPYFGKSDRDNVTGMPSLIGSWVTMFMEVEDAFHKAQQTTEQPSDPNEVIRTIAKEIALAVHHYVSNANVTTDVDPSIAVPPMIAGGYPVTGKGKGTGKLS
jgi:hypothetical protein